MDEWIIRFAWQVSLPIIMLRCVAMAYADYDTRAYLLVSDLQDAGKWEAVVPRPQCLN